jgi:hypothetical protein
MKQHLRSRKELKIYLRARKSWKIRPNRGSYKAESYKTALALDQFPESGQLLIGGEEERKGLVT